MTNSLINATEPVAIIESIDQTNCSAVIRWKPTQNGGIPKEIDRIGAELYAQSQNARVADEYTLRLLNNLGRKLDECFGYGDEDIEELLDEWRDFTITETQPTGCGCLCQGCGKHYQFDVIVDDGTWEEIKPDGKPTGSGLLCPNCITSRLQQSRAGIWSAGYLSPIEQ